MAEIELEKRRRRGGAGWIWMVVALAVIGLIILWLWPTGEPGVAYEEIEESEMEEVEEVGEVEPPPPLQEPEVVVVTTIVADPASWIGRTVQGEVEVAEVPTDRGFWISEGEDRLFVVLDPLGGDAVPDINPNTTLRLQEAVVRDASFVAQMTDLDEDTRQILEGVETFLVVDGNDVEVLEPSPT